MIDPRHLALTWLALQTACAALRMSAVAAEQTRRQTEVMEKMTVAMQGWMEADREATRLIKEWCK